MGVGKGRGKGNHKGKAPADGGTDGGIHGGTHGGGEEVAPAVGGSKAQQVLENRRPHELPFESSVLYLQKDGTWWYREGKCVTLAHLFARMGSYYWSACRLYAYYNNCRLLTTKRQHSWSSPVGGWKWFGTAVGVRQLAVLLAVGSIAV